MTCPAWRERLSAYHDQQCSPAEARQVAAHLDDCPACRDTLAQLDADRARFLAAYAASTGGADLRMNIMEELRMMAPTPNPLQKQLLKLRWLLAGAAAVAVLCFALLMSGLLPSLRQGNARVEVARNTEALTDDSGETVDQNTTGHGGRQAELAWTPGDQATGYVDSRNPKVDDTFSTQGSPEHLDAVDHHIGQGYTNYALNGYHIRISNVNTRSDNVSDILDWQPADNSGIKMAYDVNYRLQVKDALRQAREAQQIVQQHGGFTTDFVSQREDGQLPYAEFHGKVPAAQAEATLQALEKLGEVRGISIAGEDLTTQLQQQLDEMARQEEHARKLEKIGNRAPSKTALSAEAQRNSAKAQLVEAKRSLLGLKSRHALVTLSATFVEGKPREALTFAQTVSVTRNVLRYLLLLLAAVAAFFLLLALLIAPWIMLRRWTRKATPAETRETAEE